MFHRSAVWLMFRESNWMDLNWPMSMFGSLTASLVGFFRVENHSREIPLFRDSFKILSSSEINETLKHVQGTVGNIQAQCEFLCRILLRVLLWYCDVGFRAGASMLEWATSRSINYPNWGWLPCTPMLTIWSWIFALFCQLSKYLVCPFTQSFIHLFVYPSTHSISKSFTQAVAH